MKPCFKYHLIGCLFLAVLLEGLTFGYELNSKLSIGLVVAAAAQHQFISGDPLAEDVTRGAMPIQPDASYRPWASGEFYARFGFAIGNGLNPVSPFHLVPWAADLEDNVKDINDRGRDYLLTARYRHTFAFPSGQKLSLSGGILDSTNLLDLNVYANDDKDQFMNQIFENSGSYGLPSYDYGLAVEWTRESWSANALVMRVGGSADGEPFTFAGIQIGTRLDTEWGAGNVRAILAGADDQFINSDGDRLESRMSWGVSIDQEMGDHLGGFLRFAWQRDDVEVLYSTLYSGGIEIKGQLWGRERDRIGIGLAYLEGGSSVAEHTHAFECYYRAMLTDHFGVTGDVQYMNDENRQGSSPSGWVLGVRTTARF